VAILGTSTWPENLQHSKPAQPWDQDPRLKFRHQLPMVRNLSWPWMPSNEVDFYCDIALPKLYCNSDKNQHTHKPTFHQMWSLPTAKLTIPKTNFWRCVDMMMIIIIILNIVFLKISGVGAQSLTHIPPLLCHGLMSLTAARCQNCGYWIKWRLKHQ